MGGWEGGAIAGGAWMGGGIAGGRVAGWTRGAEDSPLVCFCNFFVAYSGERGNLVCGLF